MADSREIVLNVYDFDDVPASRFLAWMKCGIHHSAVMIGNREWTFSDAGVFTMRPRAAPRCTIRESIVLAEHRGSYNDVTAVVQSLRAHFPPGSYDLCKKNCNHFAEAFCQALVGVSIPPWVNRAAGFGSSRSALTGQLDAPLSEPARSRFEQMCSRRLARQPVQYILGDWDFHELTLQLRAPVLIPRPETEQLVEMVLAAHGDQPALRLLDVG